MTIRVLSLKIEDTLEDSEINRLLEYVSDEKRDRIERYVHREDAQRGLLADILARYSLCTTFDLRNSQLSFCKNGFAKPMVVNHADVHFNVSHSGEWVVCCVHNNPVGVDVEKVQSIDFSIASRFFTREEVEYIMLEELDEAQKLSRFYEIWTLKESYIKAVGKGLSIPLDSFSISVSDNEIKIRTENDYGRYFFRQYPIEIGYKLAVCGSQEDFSKNIVTVDYMDLLRWLD